MMRFWFSVGAAQALILIIGMSAFLGACNVDVNGYRARGGSTGKVKCSGKCD